MLTLVSQLSMSRQFDLLTSHQVLDSWFCIKSLTRPMDPEFWTAGQPTHVDEAVRNDPSYEESMNLTVKYDEDLPSYEEAVSSV